MTNESREIVERYIQDDKPRIDSKEEIFALIRCIPFLLLGIMGLFSLLANKYGVAFLTYIGYPVLVIFLVLFVYYFKKILFNVFYINTDFGKCKVKLKKASIYIYCYKTMQNFEMRKSLISRFFPNLFSKYTKLLIIRDTKLHIKNIISWMKVIDEQFFSLYTFIKDAELNVEYINLEEKVMHKVNINTANLKQLKKLPFLEKTDALKIESHIQKIGEFKNLWEFAEFINLPQEKFEILYRYITVTKTKNDLPVIERIRQDMPQFDNTLDIL